MRRLKTEKSTPLRGSNLVDDWHERKLRALGVTTVEELFGLVQSDPDATSQFLEVSHLAALQSNAVSRAAPQLLAAMDEFTRPRFELGALPPPEIEVEERASEQTFDRYLAQADPDIAGGQIEREGVDLRSCFGPVRDQRRRGTCVAHAVVAATGPPSARAASWSDRHRRSLTFVRTTLVPIEATAIEATRVLGPIGRFEHRAAS